MTEQRRLLAVPAAIMTATSLRGWPRGEEISRAGSPQAVDGEEREDVEVAGTPLAPAMNEHRTMVTSDGSRHTAGRAAILSDGLVSVAFGKADGFVRPAWVLRRRRTGNRLCLGFRGSTWFRPGVMRDGKDTPGGRGIGEPWRPAAS